MGWEKILYYNIGNIHLLLFYHECSEQIFDIQYRLYDNLPNLKKNYGDDIPW